jgi:hypothetical protein
MNGFLWAYVGQRYTAKILYRKFETYIPSAATVPIPTFKFLCAIYLFP